MKEAYYSELLSSSILFRKIKLDAPKKITFKFALGLKNYHQFVLTLMDFRVVIIIG